MHQHIHTQPHAPAHSHPAPCTSTFTPCATAHALHERLQVCVVCHDQVEVFMCGPALQLCTHVHQRGIDVLNRRLGLDRVVQSLQGGCGPRMWRKVWAAHVAQRFGLDARGKSVGGQVWMVHRMPCCGGFQSLQHRKCGHDGIQAI
eukprot:120991-Chlamydomonas_euryale.AAC.1